ncbi:hypothetical protein B0H63DRAFT_403181 [Podospora didyma]|uniref:F-box domain-containing protein n=1 Tax=Podospora didyma TaxID=330526 RepID=A0AAE0K5S1_9PEZI|nr:hypothetical protein B0H63DRAFT_403181 [Podospora didyma]
MPTPLLQKLRPRTYSQDEEHQPLSKRSRIRESYNVDEQNGSLFFQRLPKKLRDEIYSFVFTSTRLSFGEREMGDKDRPWHFNIKPVPNSLALLRTCRLAKKEIGTSWLGQVLFSFEDNRTFLDKMTALPPNLLSQVRRLRLMRECLVLENIMQGGLVRVPVDCLFKFLPGLRLDEFTVISSPLTLPENDYMTVNDLIAYGSGWKVLHYIFDSSVPLAYRETEMGRPYWRKSQPEDWKLELEQRDGRLSKPKVKIARAKGAKELIFDKQHRMNYVQKRLPGEEQADQPLPTDRKLKAEGMMAKAMIVVAKRGIGVDYEEEGGVPSRLREIVGIREGAWEEFRPYFSNSPKYSREHRHIMIDFYQGSEDMTRDIVRRG